MGIFACQVCKRRPEKLEYIRSPKGEKFAFCKDCARAYKARLNVPEGLSPDDYDVCERCGLPFWEQDPIFCVNTDPHGFRDDSTETETICVFCYLAHYGSQYLDSCFIVGGKE